MDGSSDPTLSIGTFARRSRLSPKALRLSPKALRLYDRMGVFTPAQVDEHNGYRLYLESQLAIARLVVSLRRLDMPLARVAEVVGAPEGRRAELIEALWIEVETRVSGQRALQTHLLNGLIGTGSGCDGYEVHERDVPEQRVLSELRHTTVEGLTDWMGAALGRLHGAATELGLQAGSSFVIFDGQVDEDSDGPVEVCVPVAGDADLCGQPIRVEAAHREAYTEITKAQVGFPQILSAYDAVERWVVEHGRQIVDPPREIYVDDFIHLGPDDHGCDIAFPVIAGAGPTCDPGADVRSGR